MSAQDLTVAWVGVGSNLDDPEKQVALAMDVLDMAWWCEVIARSSLYVTEPIGFVNQPNFVNAVCRIGTPISSNLLLERLLNLESELGRIRDSLPNRPRTIDFDLLLYGDEILKDEFLELPHPQMHERRFVLEPLVEIDPDIHIPGKGMASELLIQCSDQHVERKYPSD